MEFFEHLKRHNRIELTQQQKQAVLATEGKNLLLACPGSGKTTVMVIKTAYLVMEKSVKPEQILTLTFSVAAARDMERRYHLLFGDQIIKPKFSTIHSFCYHLMQTYFQRQGISRENIEGENKYKLTKSILLSRMYETINKERATEEIIDKLSGEISFIKNLLIHPDDFEQHPFETNNLKEIYLAYAKQKDAHQLYDFDDMLLIAYKALKQYPDILQQLQQKYQYIQVDEAQDNSKVQNQVIRMLVTEKNHLFMVADDDQMIYEWRGAHPDGILQFETIYQGGSIFRMEENFRSSFDIVSTANTFIKKNRVRYDKNILTKNPVFKPIMIEQVRDENDQIKSVLNKIRNSSGTLSEHAVLYRNNMTAILFADAFMAEKVPFQLRGSKPYFFKHWIIEDIKNYLLFSLDTKQLQYFDTLFYKNQCFISKAGYDIAREHTTSSVSIFDSIIKYGGIKDFQKSKITTLERQIKHLKKVPVVDSIAIIENDIGYMKWLETSGKKNGVSPDLGIKMIGTLKRLARQCKDILTFMAKLEDLQQAFDKASKEKGTGVNLTTVHSSKGLEFDHVYLVDLSDGIFPSFEALLEQEKERYQQIEAERRLFYVGKTRARFYLTLYETTTQFGVQVKPSQFLQEIKMIMNPNDTRKKNAIPRTRTAKKSLYVQTPKEKALEKAYNRDGQNGVYEQGQQIRHMTFGQGIISLITDTTIEVDFENGVSKKFDLKTVCQSQLLKPVVK